MGDRQSDQDALFVSRLEDLIVLSQNKNIVKFSHFLDERQVFISQRLISSRKLSCCMLWGGYPEAERCQLGVFPDYLEPASEQYPITPVTITYKSEYELSHRDFLGALMSLQLKREAIGDILVSPGRTIIFLLDTAQPVVLSELSQVGRVGVKICGGLEGELPDKSVFEELTGTVASPRLDCVVSMLTGKSREKSAALIRAGLVLVNHQAVDEVSTLLQPSDRLTIRGYGKFIFGGETRRTKKDRLLISVQKYV